MKFFILIFCSVLLTVSGRPGCPGCVTRLSGSELTGIEEKLMYTLNKLAAADGPYYRLNKINTATTQIVAGIKNVISADLIDNNNQTRTCKITMWSKPWLVNGTEINFECPGEKKITKRHGS